MSLIADFSHTVHEHVSSSVTTFAELAAGAGMTWGGFWNLYHNPKFRLVPWRVRPFSAWCGMSGLYVEFCFGLFLIADACDRGPDDLPPIAVTSLALGIFLIQIRSFAYEKWTPPHIDLGVHLKRMWSAKG